MSSSPQVALDLLILKTLSITPNHGFGITLHIETASSQLLKVEEGSLYPALHRLERSGHISSEWSTTPNGRRARVYTLTATGAQRLSEAEATWGKLASGVSKVLKFA